MKWEDNIKKTLEKRRIEPSKASWNTLADQLDAADARKSNGLYWWIGIAASLVAILFTVTIFFNDSVSDVQKPILVKYQEHLDNPMPMNKVPQQDQVVATHQDGERLKSLPENSTKNTLKNGESHKKNVISATEKQNATLVRNEKPESIEPLQLLLQKETIEDIKVSEIVARIQNLKSTGHTVTDADIDALLQKAQKEITYQTINESLASVNANALLKDVETDLQQSFRNKIFEALRDSYETVKTAVAERNN